MKAFLRIASVLLATTALVVFAQAPRVLDEFSGKALSLIDGDTLRIQHGDQKSYFVVQLEGIATPEKKQSFNREAKDALSEMVVGKVVTVKVTGRDKSARTLGIVMVNGTDVNSALVEKGLAWHDKKRNNDSQLAKLEETARKAKRGLWSEANPVAPWDFKKQHAEGDTATSTSPSTTKTAKTMFWLNIKSNVRHNQTCEHYGKTADGRACTKDEGKPCGRCGG